MFHNNRYVASGNVKKNSAKKPVDFMFHPESKSVGKPRFLSLFYYGDYNDYDEGRRMDRPLPTRRRRLPPGGRAEPAAGRHRQRRQAMRRSVRLFLKLKQVSV